ncbi:ABC transporter substrate-binding protein [Paenibacillus agilis]|uniref:Extracellular solute-binding protein n=1 Tax=Paenibacillus agilis TaxID=3020863 RepID=A0A559J0E1_9BACL|nr:extracellular solute-binding protein [Paenibacillus agilis]TVX93354.1 extracellular solute-binding protein [Paenibacillus agilis]
MRRIRKRYAAVILLLGSVIFISGCFGNNSESDELSANSKSKGKLKVYYPYVEDFHNKYGKLFNSKYPNIEFEIIRSTEEGNSESEHASPSDKLKRMLEQQKPDLLVLNQDEYDHLASLGKLHHLEPIIKQEQFDLNSYAPGLIDMLRMRGNSSLFGLAPVLNARFLYYNVDMFKEKHIDPPINSMQWKELFELASLFHNDKADKEVLYGLMDNQASDVLWGIAATMGLQLFDAEGKKVMLQSEGWKQAFQLTVDAIQGNAVSVRPPEQSGDPGSRYMMAMNQFVNGNIPMIINDASFAAYIGESSKLNWGMVTVPIDPTRADESMTTNATQIIAIAADSTNKQEAWEFVKFVNGPEMAKIISRTGRSDLPARTGHIPRSLERGAEILYMLKPAKHRVNEQWKKNIPDGFYEAYEPMLNEALHAVIDEKKSLVQAIVELEQQAQIELDLIRKKE